MAFNNCPDGPTKTTSASRSPVLNPLRLYIPTIHNDDTRQLLLVKVAILSRCWGRVLMVDDFDKFNNNKK